MFLIYDEVKIAADVIADILENEYQLTYGIHTDEPNLHIHFIINSISYLNGKTYKTNTSYFPVFYKAISEVFDRCNIGTYLGGYNYEL